MGSSGGAGRKVRRDPGEKEGADKEKIKIVPPTNAWNKGKLIQPKLSPVSAHMRGKRNWNTRSRGKTVRCPTVLCLEQPRKRGQKMAVRIVKHHEGGEGVAVWTSWAKYKEKCGGPDALV